MQHWLRDKSLDTPVATEANGSLEELDIQPDVGLKLPHAWVASR